MILPANRGRVRTALAIASSNAKLELRALEAFNLIDKILTDKVGFAWECVSTNDTSGAKSTKRMGTVCHIAVSRIVCIAGGMPIVDVGFGYGQVLFQLQMLGANVCGGMEMANEYTPIANEVYNMYFKHLPGYPLELEMGKLTCKWIVPQQPRVYYMNNLALEPKENEAIWKILSQAPVGSKVITTSLMTHIRGGGWEMNYDKVPFAARHSIHENGKQCKRGLVCYTRVW